jgi:hypothetical protein
MDLQLGDVFARLTVGTGEEEDESLVERGTRYWMGEEAQCSMTGWWHRTGHQPQDFASVGTGDADHRDGCSPRCCREGEDCVAGGGGRFHMELGTRG